MTDALAFVGLSDKNAGLGRAAWFFVSLTIARIAALILMGVLSGSSSYLPTVITYVIPTAMAGDATMIATFIALKKLALTPRILLTAFATTAVTFALQALRQSIPDALGIAFAVGILFPSLFLTGLSLIKAKPVVTLGLSMLLAVFIGSVVGDLLTFMRMQGTAEQLPRILASAIMVLEHGAVFTAVTCAFMSFTQPNLRKAV